MPYPVPVGSVLEMRLIGRLHGQQVMCTFHYSNEQNALVDGAQSAFEALTTFETGVWDSLRGGLSNELQGVFMEAQWIYPVRYRTRFKPPANTAGSQAGNSLPSTSTIVVRRQGQNAARWAQGRVYLPGIPTSAELDSKVEGAYYTAHEANFRSAMTAVMADVGLELFDPVLWSPSTPGRRTAIISTFVDPVLRVQRRREVGVGV